MPSVYMKGKDHLVYCASELMCKKPSEGPTKGAAHYSYLLLALSLHVTLAALQADNVAYVCGELFCAQCAHTPI